jgi:hypothetical protein
VALALVFIRQNDNRIQLIVSCKWAFTVYKSFVSTSLNIIHRGKTIWIYEINYTKNELSVLLIET